VRTGILLHLDRNKTCAVLAEKGNIDAFGAFEVGPEFFSDALQRPTSGLE
jgi:hypothetical protein